MLDFELVADIDIFGTLFLELLDEEVGSLLGFAVGFQRPALQDLKDLKQKSVPISKVS